MKLPVFDNRETILIVPLNWGRGHAMRLLPVIEFYKQKHRVILVGEKPLLVILRRYFPALKYEELPLIFQVQFDTSFFSLKKILPFLKKLHQLEKKDTIWASQLQKKYGASIIISDNRYGFKSSKTKNILITHQLNPILPKQYAFFRSFVRKIILKKIHAFDVCWIPDIDANDNLTGMLSHLQKMPSNADFIGILSRFEGKKQEIVVEQSFDVVVILSGPEPQRSIFEKKIVDLLKDTGYKVAVLQGLSEKEQYTVKQITFFSDVDDDHFATLVKSAKIVIARAGYSTIMDLVALNVNAFLVPTPRQTEQLYLAQYLQKHPLFTEINESELSLEDFKSMV